MFSAHGLPALPQGTIITFDYPTSDAQAASATEFRGLTAVNTLDRTAMATEATSTVSSGFTLPTSQAQKKARSEVSGPSSAFIGD